MGIDIRFPIGLFFTVTGALLAVFGVFSNREIYQRSLGINVNLVWGAVLLLVGITMLALVFRSSKSKSSASKKKLSHDSQVTTYDCSFLF
jgi:putative Mn2+ efflux pump MntP